jgi:hypothetical protein
MGLWSRLIRRQRGVLAEGDPEVDGGEKVMRPATPPPTPTGRRAPMPKPTAGTPHFDGPEPTAGTPSYRGLGGRGTPSTRRIHNPSHPGR